MALSLWSRVPDADDIAGIALVGLLEWAAELAKPYRQQQAPSVCPTWTRSRSPPPRGYLLPTGQREQELERPYDVAYCQR